MGLYNIVRAEVPCGACGRQVFLHIQYKYGSLRLIDYELGDEVTFDSERGAIGRADEGSVVVDGYGEKCPACGGEPGDYYVFIKNGRLWAVDNDDGRFDFSQGYVLLNERPSPPRE